MRVALKLFSEHSEIAAFDPQVCLVDQCFLKFVESNRHAKLFDTQGFRKEIGDFIQYLDIHFEVIDDARMPDLNGYLNSASNTSRPPILPLWTCAIEPDAIGQSSKSVKTSSIFLPNACWNCWWVSYAECGFAASLKLSNECVTCSPKMSPLWLAHCPSFIHNGPAD